MTCILKRLIAGCGALPEHILQYAPRLRTLLPKHNNRTDDEIRRCLRTVSTTGCDRGCRVSCSEMIIQNRRIITTKEGFYKNKGGPIIRFSFNSKTLTNITEIPVYPAEKFVTDIGGWLGLFSGMSLLSVLEIILFVTLSTAALYRKIKQYLTTRRLNINPSPA